VAGRQQMARHRTPHDTKADKADVCHMSIPYLKEKQKGV
jgi:hypothetical protein